MLLALSVELAQLQMDKVGCLFSVGTVQLKQMAPPTNHPQKSSSDKKLHHRSYPHPAPTPGLQDSVHCALEMSRLQLEDWKNQGPLAQEEALIQKALLQEELVTIRARMCDVSLVRWYNLLWCHRQIFKCATSVDYSIFCRLQILKGFL